MGVIMLRKGLFCLIACIVFFGWSFSFAEQIKFARYPHSCMGKLAFTYQGDIWITNIDGSNPVRLTDHIANDEYPKFSPDGKWIAFTSDRMGNNDVWVIPVTGGEPRQLTFLTVSDNVRYWTPDGKRIIFSTSRGERNWGSPLYTVSFEGDLPMPLDMDYASWGMMSQDGTKIAFNRENFTYWRKHYKGNNQTDVWVQDVKTKKITQLTDINITEFKNHVQDAFPMWGADGMIYFLSERDGYFNIWKISPTGGDPKQVTFFKKDGVQFPSISPDGKLITFENEFDLWKLAVPNGNPERITINVAFDTKKNLVEYVTSQSQADGFSPSPNGDYIAVDYHGELFIIPSDPEFGEKKQMTASGWRDRYEEYSPDGKYIAYISDESLEEEIWLYEIAAGTRMKVSNHESTKSGGMVWSPDSKKFVYVAANTLFMYDVEKQQTAQLAYNQAGGFNVSEFSKDGNWLVYSHSDDDQNTDVYLFEIAARREYNISQNPFRDSGGILTPDGKKVVFTSSRDAGVNHLFIVSLERIKEDPDDPLVKERLKKERSGAQRETEQFALSVDVTGIDRRAVQLTRGTNAVGSYFLSADGRTIYYTSSDDKGPGLFSIGIDGKNQRKETDGTFGRLTPTYDKKTVFYQQQSNIYKMPLSSKSKEQVRFTIKVKIDKRAEWEQIFEECWRVMKYRFYDPNMHGFDWASIKKEYKPLLQYVGEYQDVYSIANEMIGELNASHTGVSGPSGVEIPSTYQTRLLGFEMMPADGVYKITHIYRSGPADKEWLNLKEGDYVLAIDNVPLKAGENYWKILINAVNEYIPIKVADTPDGRTNQLDVRIKSVTSLSSIKYEEWVEKNREFVEKETNGEIAYVHIQSMNQPSLDKFVNEIDRYWNKKGIIIDIRYNGGGNIDQELLDILERRPYEYWNSRWGASAWGRRPKQTIAGPKVMLVNNRSFSDSEVTPMGFRDLELGRIVGTPTGGGVIATGSYSLINGGSIRTPGSKVMTYDPKNPNNYGVNLENYGVPPDVWAENTPEDELKGYDRELKAAIDEVLRMLKEGTWQYIKK
jgi:tricorn protease